MADTVTGAMSSSEQIKANYEKYADKFKDSTKELVNSETFLSLLVAEMTNQDPLEPSSNTEFISQMAQFTSLTYAQDSSKYAMANYASSLVGKTATGTKMDGGNLVTKTGVVESVTKNGDNYTVTIDGTPFELSAISGVSTGASNATGTITGSALGDQISRASMMVGMLATVSLDKDGTPYVDTGIIEAIQVKNGEISAVINGIAYKLSDIVEVTYATASDNGDSTDKTGDADKVGDTEASDKTDEAGSTEDTTPTDDIEDVTEETLDEMLGNLMDELDEQQDVEEQTSGLEPEEYAEDLQDVTQVEL